MLFRTFHVFINYSPPQNCRCLRIFPCNVRSSAGTSWHCCICFHGVMPVYKDVVHVIIFNFFPPSFSVPKHSNTCNSTEGAMLSLKMNLGALWLCKLFKLYFHCFHDNISSFLYVLIVCCWQLAACAFSLSCTCLVCVCEMVKFHYTSIFSRYQVNLWMNVVSFVHIFKTENKQNCFSLFKILL